ncbi:MAG: ATP-binding protein [Candidatus Latescibacterota bacterium]
MGRLESGQDESQRRLMQAGKLASIGELASGVAHELNNPAGIILMRLARLAQEAESAGMSPEAREDIQVIRRQVEKISRIVAGLVAFSGRSSSALRPTEVNGIVRRTALLVEDLARTRRVEVCLELGASLPSVWADSAQIEQVLLNLTNNALDAMPDGGQLTFRTRPAEHPRCGRAVSIEVADTGTGIAAEHLPRIFDPFFTTKEVGKGTGLGLSISYGIMQEHGGSIEVDSRPGEGTSFTLFVPVIQRDGLHGQ